MLFDNTGRIGFIGQNSLLGACLLLGACSHQARAHAEAQPASVACAGGVIHATAEAEHYRGCGVVQGDLRIEASNLQNLDALLGLQQVSGTLTLNGNDELEDIEGLHTLLTVGALEITNNRGLDSLDGLRNLSSVRSIQLENVPRLRSLRGLEGVEALALLVLKRTGLCSTAGLDGLRQVGALEITQNPALISVHALNDLERADSVHIELNPRLAAQPGLLPRVEIEQAVIVRNNQGLSAGEVAHLSARLRPLGAELLAAEDGQL